MADAEAHWANCGFPVALHANPTDHYLDIVTPGGYEDHADEMVAFFVEKLKPRLDALVDLKRSQKSMTAADMIRAKHQKASEAQLGPAALRLHPVAAPFLLQLRVLLRRKLAITKRNRASIIMPIAVPIAIGVFMGLMFQGIGSKPLFQQLSFIFMLMTRICMGGMQLMPALLEERNIMKHDISEGLYSVSAFLMVSLAVDISLSLIGVLANTVIMFAFSGIPWTYFGVILGWGLVMFFVFDAIFGLIAALASTVQLAQVSAIPLITVFMIFSGFMISKASSPGWLRWLFEISPLGYAMQSIFVYMADDHGLEGDKLLTQFGFERNQDLKGLLIMLAFMVIFRTLQVVSLTFANNIQK